MPHDLMTSLLGGSAGNPFPGAYSPQNPYSWLDGLSETHQRSTGSAYGSNRLANYSSKATFSTSIIDLTNDDRKRPLESLASSAYGQPDPKRMRVKYEHVSRPVGGQQGTPGRPTHVDHSGSPPPTRRSDREHQHGGHHPPSSGPSKHNPAQTSSSNTWKSSNRTGSMNLPQSGTDGAAPNPLSSSSLSRPQQTAQFIVKQQSDAFARPIATSGPFDVDDSSDDERASKPVQALRTPSTSPPPVAESKRLRSRPQIAMSQRERQILESRKRRQEAAEKKRATPTSSRGSHNETRLGEHGEDQMEIDQTSSILDRGSAKAPETRKYQASFCRTLTKYTSPAKDSVVDLPTDDEKKAPTKSRLEENKRLSQAPGSTWKPESLYEERRRSKELVKRQKNAELHARVQAPDKKEKQQAEASRAAESKRQTESDELQQSRARMQEEYDRRVAAQAEMALRSRARVEVSRREAQQEAEAKRKEKEQRDPEQREWGERKGMRDQQREVLRKHQTEEDMEKHCLHDQQAALARLNVVRPPQQPRDEQQAETDTNKNSARHTTPTGLHFKRDNGSFPADAARNKVKGIQDRNAQGGLLRSRPGSMSESSRREERIKTLEERNARLREAEKRADEDGYEDLRRSNQSQTPKHPARLVEQAEQRDSKASMSAPTPLALPKGPQALSSAVGQALLVHANANPATTAGRPATEKQSSKNHGRQLGEILFEDVQLIKWRDEGIRFEDIVILWKRQFSPSKSQDTLRKRYRQIKEAMKSASIEQNLLDRILAGSAEARKEVNLAIHGRWPLSNAPTGQRDVKGHFISKHERSGSGESGGARAVTTVARSGLLSPNLTSSFASATTEGTAAADENAGSRPHVGGKRLGPKEYLHFMENIREVDAEEKPEAPTPREQSPICKDDYYHFAYQVQRREISQQDLDDGFVIDDDDQWRVCDEPLDKLSRANKKAAQEATCLPKKWKYEGDSDVEFEISSRNLEDGKKIFNAIWQGVGQVQVRVARYIRYHQDNVRPTSKDGWAPKSVYFVRERKFEEIGDDVFLEKKETEVTRSVDNTVYTTLEEANAEAIKHFVSIAFESRSANLTQREIEVNEMVKKIGCEFAEEEGGKDEEGPCFQREIEAEDGRRKVEVWVEEGRLKGPRNL